MPQGRPPPTTRTSSCKQTWVISTYATWMRPNVSHIEHLPFTPAPLLLLGQEQNLPCMRHMTVGGSGYCPRSRPKHTHNLYTQLARSSPTTTANCRAPAVQLPGSSWCWVTLGTAAAAGTRIQRGAHPLLLLRQARVGVGCMQGHSRLWKTPSRVGCKAPHLPLTVWQHPKLRWRTRALLKTPHRALPCRAPSSWLHHASC
jgi:hypothetical protein